MFGSPLTCHNTSNRTASATVHATPKRMAGWLNRLRGESGSMGEGDLTRSFAEIPPDRPILPIVSILDSCKHQFAVHGLAVDLACEVPLLNIPIHKALGDFAVNAFPDGFTPAVGWVRPYEQSVVLRHLSPTATPVAATGSMELYEEGERFWLIDDRWGLTEMNLLKGQFQSWILPKPTIDPSLLVQDAVL